MKFLPVSIAYFDEGGISGTEIYEEEKKRVLNELFPYRVYDVIVSAKGVKEIKNTLPMRFLYSLLYRLSCVVNKHIR